MATKTCTKNFKDSGIEWIGKIPQDWHIQKIKHFGEISLGKMLQNDDSGNDHLKPYLRAQNIQWEKVDVADVKEMWFSTYELAKHRIKKNDLLVSEGGEVGRTAIWQDELSECYVQNSINRVTIKRGRPEYYLYAFEALGKSGVFDAVVNRVSIAHLTREKLKEIQIAVPPDEIQDGAVSILNSKTSTIDHAIEQKRKLIDLLKEKRAAIISRAVTRGLDENVELVDSDVEWIGKVPKGWKILKFKYVGRFVSGGTPATEKLEYWDGSIPWISPKDMKSDEIVDSEDHITPAGLANTAGAIVPKGSLLLVYRSGILRHSIPTAINAVDAAVNQDIRAVLLKKNVSAKYLHYLVQGKVDALLNIWSKNGATVESLEHGYVANTPMPLPSKKEQDAIVAYLDKAAQLFDQISVEVSRSIELLTEYRTSLISHVVAGKVEVTS